MTKATSRQVRTRYGDVSDMTLWRWLQDEKLGFPKPTYIMRRRYFDLSELDAFDRRMAGAAVEPVTGADR